MKATENLLKRPRSILKKPEDTRFLFILLANPLLSSPGAYSHARTTQTSHRDDRRPSNPNNLQSTTRDGKAAGREPGATASSHNNSNHHYGILKRILGLLANLPNEAHHTFISWFSRFSPKQFERHVDLIGGFVNYRLTRQHGRKRTQIAMDSKDGDQLVPSFASATGNTPAELHAAINRRSPQKKPTKKKEAPIIYAEDWQIRAAARIMSLLFAANSSNYSRRPDGMESKARHRTEAGANSQARQQGYMVSIDSFYNTLLDYSDLIGDFEIWESKSSKFCFCSYPFFLSIWAKIRIMEHDARRQMEVKARDAFFSSILSHQAVSQYLVLKVRRECLVEDSLRGVSEVVGTGQEEIKKGLRIEFLGEEGVDAGGLRKEWFLLLVREVFDPDHGKSDNSELGRIFLTISRSFHL
jgi:E3 ubiquitin-protein ligase HECTD2